MFCLAAKETPVGERLKRLESGCVMRNSRRRVARALLVTSSGVYRVYVNLPPPPPADARTEKLSLRARVCVCVEEGRREKLLA